MKDEKTIGVNCYYFSVPSRTIRLYVCIHENEDNCESCEEEGAVFSAVLVKYNNDEHYYCVESGLPINELVSQRDKGLEI